MNQKNLVIQNYKKFCSLEGSEYIASEFALEIILKIVEKYKINSILELGLGIGSISDTVLKYSKNNNSKINYVGTEKNEFCLNALKNNVEDYKQIELHSELVDVKNKKFDLIIIDGYDDSLREIVSFCKENAIVFIEGDRKGQTETILTIFPKYKYVNVISLNKNKPYAHGTCETSHYVGGGQLIFINPTLKMKRHWFKEKVKTYIKNKIRKLRKK
jgi:spore coat polysaccharide biosynthesis predicted glycosyltransferase SpsG